MSTIIQLQDKKLPSDCLLFKHSTACPVSHRAATEVRSLDFLLPLYWINVIESRDLSNWVESQYGIRHESPQLLFIKDSKAVKVWNHSEIRKENLKQLLAGG
ncbi:MAG: DUF2847 family protein [Candidatus Dadabacteria bacterium]|nr:MAG: DUF2847 family protein [Candidatus Dadabacteria bacterium]